MSNSPIDVRNSRGVSHAREGSRSVFPRPVLPSYIVSQAPLKRGNSPRSSGTVPMIRPHSEVFSPPARVNPASSSRLELMDLPEAAPKYPLHQNVANMTTRKLMRPLPTQLTSELLHSSSLNEHNPASQGVDHRRYTSMSRDVSSISTSSSVNLRRASIHVVHSDEVDPNSLPSHPKFLISIAKMAFSGISEQGELSFPKGAEILVTKWEPEHGARGDWWYGTLIRGGDQSSMTSALRNMKSSYGSGPSTLHSRGFRQKSQQEGWFPRLYVSVSGVTNTNIHSSTRARTSNLSSRGGSGYGQSHPRSGYSGNIDGKHNSTLNANDGEILHDVLEPLIVSSGVTRHVNDFGGGRTPLLEQVTENSQIEEPATSIDNSEYLTETRIRDTVREKEILQSILLTLQRNQLNKSRIEGNLQDMQKTVGKQSFEGKMHVVNNSNQNLDPARFRDAAMSGNAVESNFSSTIESSGSHVNEEVPVQSVSSSLLKRPTDTVGERSEETDALLYGTLDRIGSLLPIKPDEFGFPISEVSQKQNRLESSKGENVPCQHCGHTSQSASAPSKVPSTHVCNCVVSELNNVPVVLADHPISERAPEANSCVTLDDKVRESTTSPANINVLSTEQKRSLNYVDNEGLTSRIIEPMDEPSKITSDINEVAPLSHATSPRVDAGAVGIENASDRAGSLSSEMITLSSTKVKRPPPRKPMPKRITVEADTGVPSNSSNAPNSPIVGTSGSNRRAPTPRLGKSGFLESFADPNVIFDENGVAIPRSVPVPPHVQVAEISPGKVYENRSNSDSVVSNSTSIPSSSVENLGSFVPSEQSDKDGLPLTSNVLYSIGSTDQKVKATLQSFNETKDELTRLSLFPTRISTQSTSSDKEKTIVPPASNVSLEKTVSEEPDKKIGTVTDVSDTITSVRTVRGRESVVPIWESRLREILAARSVSIKGPVVPGRKLKTETMSGQDLWDDVCLRLLVIGFLVRRVRERESRSKITSLLALGLFVRVGRNAALHRCTAPILTLGMCVRAGRVRTERTRATKLFLLGLMLHSGPSSLSVVPFRVEPSSSSAQINSKLDIQSFPVRSVPSAEALAKGKVRGLHWDAVTASAAVGTIWDRRSYRDLRSKEAVPLDLLRIGVDAFVDDDDDAEDEQGGGEKEDIDSLLPRPASLRLEEGELSELMPELVTAFIPPASSGAKPAGGSRAVVGSSSSANSSLVNEERIAVLPADVSQNVAITVSSILSKSSLDSIRRAVFELDADSLPLEKVQLLLSNATLWDREKLAPLVRSTVALSRMLPHEAFVREVLLNVPNARPRLLALEFMGTWEFLVLGLCKAARSLALVCSEIEQSRRLSTLLVDVVLPLANTLNVSKNAASNSKTKKDEASVKPNQVVGVKLSSLLRLATSRTPNGKSFSQVIVEGLFERRRDILELEADFKVLLDLCSSPSGLSIFSRERVTTDSSRVELSLRQAQALLQQLSASSAAVEAQALAHLTPVVQQCTSAWNSAQKLLDATAVAVEKLALWLGEDRASEPTALIAPIRDFILLIIKETKQHQEKVDRLMASQRRVLTSSRIGPSSLSQASAKKLQTHPEAIAAAARRRMETNNSTEEVGSSNISTNLRILSPLERTIANGTSSGSPNKSPRASGSPRTSPKGTISPKKSPNYSVVRKNLPLPSAGTIDASLDTHATQNVLRRSLKLQRIPEAVLSAINKNNDSYELINSPARLSTSLGKSSPSGRLLSKSSTDAIDSSSGEERGIPLELHEGISDKVDSGQSAFLVGNSTVSSLLSDSSTSRSNGTAASGGGSLLSMLLNGTRPNSNIVHEVDVVMDDHTHFNEVDLSMTKIPKELRISNMRMQNNINQSSNSDLLSPVSITSDASEKNSPFSPVAAVDIDHLQEEINSASHSLQVSPVNVSDQGDRVVNNLPSVSRSLLSSLLSPSNPSLSKPSSSAANYLSMQQIGSSLDTNQLYNSYSINGSMEQDSLSTSQRLERGSGSRNLNSQFQQHNYTNVSNYSGNSEVGLSATNLNSIASPKSSLRNNPNRRSNR